jgi:enterochelin esterase-like enzyme
LVRLFSLCLLTVLSASAAGKLTVRLLIDAARGNPDAFRDALLATLNRGEIQKGTAVLGDGSDFVWAVEAAQRPSLVIDDQPAGDMNRVAGNLWYRFGTLRTGTSHRYHYLVDGRVFGGRTDVPAYGPDSYDRPGVPRGKLSEKKVHTSRIYEGMTSDYWVWAPAQYDPKTPAALMVWQDGQGLTAREATRAQIVFENLTHQKKIPTIVHVFISPGTIGDRRMRSIEYDSVNDAYPRFLRDEILPEVYREYNIRRDGYSRAIAGNSSGGICAFNAAWQQPDQFTRVLSRIGSFASIQWQPGTLDGGNVYPFKIRKEPKRNIRAWLQDGSEDIENTHGSWPLQNIQMANSLKMMDYDFHLSFGNGTHNGAHGSAELPEALAWLWRGYDPARTAQTFEMDPEEKAKPLFRVRIANR